MGGEGGFPAPICLHGEYCGDLTPVEASAGEVLELINPMKSSVLPGPDGAHAGS